MTNQSKHNTNAASDESWESCQADELVNLGSLLRARENRSRQVKAATAAAVASFAAILVLGTLVWTDGTNAGGISCAECYAQFDAFHTQLATGESSLDREAVTNITAHLAHCDFCRTKFESRFPGELTAALQYAGRQLVRNDVQAAIGFLQLAALSPAR